MRTLTGVSIGITLSIIAHIVWKPALGWALSRGDQ